MDLHIPTPNHFKLTTPRPYITHVEISRPSKLNAFTELMWRQLSSIFNALSVSPSVRAILLSGAGDRAFTAGIDIQDAQHTGFLGPSTRKDGDGDGDRHSNTRGEVDVARKANALKRYIKEFQDCIGSIERCEKPVICILHGISYGLALDIATCADIRLCTSDVRMAVKEVDIGLAADIGTLSRLPKVVGSSSWVKDVCLSARTFGAEEAYQVGLVSHVFETKEDALSKAIEMAELLATKGPIAVQGTKELLNHARDHGVGDSLRYTGVWNAAAVQTSDVERAVDGVLTKKIPRFEKL